MVVLRFVDGRIFLDEKEIECNKNMFLEYKNITEITGTCPHIVKYLHLDYNQFNPNNLKCLYLEYNQITSLFNKNGVLFDTGKLDTLYIE